MKFTVKGLVFLGYKKWVSKKTHKEYSVISLLTPENKVVQCFTEFEITDSIKQFDKVDVEFWLTMGKYNKLILRSIRKSV